MLFCSLRSKWGVVSKSVFSAPRIILSPSLGCFRRGQIQAVPSEDYSRQPPGSAAFLREGRETLYAQQSRKKKIMTTKNTTIEGLPAITAQLVTAEPAAAAAKSAFDPSKFIIILIQGREQVIAFPFHVQHSAIFEYVRRENPQVQVVSAGFFIADGDIFWIGGRSETLDLDSRPQDAALLKSFLVSQDRSLWDLTLLTVNGGDK
jgi:hypothetical protein